jgi:hypothetical protein
LSDHLAAQLTDPTSALAAAFIIANRHPAILQWAARMIGAEAARTPNGNGVEPHRPTKHKADHRLASRDKADERLLEAMKSAPGASIGDLAAAIDKSRNSTVSALHRLRNAGFAETREGRWRLVGPEAPHDPPLRWTRPLSGAEKAREAHLTA